MASKFVRSIRAVKNLNILSDNVTDENDLVSDLEGNVFIRTINGFVNITEHIPQEVIDGIKKDIEDIKVTNQVQYYKIETNEENIKKLQTNIEDLNTEIEEIKKVDEEQNTKIEINEINISKIKISDSGWTDLTLKEGVEPFSDPPQYKEVNINDTQEIHLRGSVKGLTGTKKVIATLPVEKELTNPHYFVQNMSKKKDKDGNTLIPFVRWTIQRNGDIVYDGCNAPTELLDGSEWNPINTNYSN